MTDATPWLDAEQQHTWRTLLAVNAQLSPALGRELQRGSELSLPDFDVLVQLTESDVGRIRVAGLATALQWERSRLSHHVKRMERRGLVQREECGDDGRGAWVVLTQVGREAIERAAPDHVRTVRRLVFDALSAEEVRALGAIIDKVLVQLAK